MKKVALHNLGCKVNAYEVDMMQQSLVEKGYEIVPFDQKADVYIVNTCTVTNIADRKSRQMLHRAKQQNPEAVVVAVGCYVQTGQKTLETDASVDLAVGNNRKKDIAEILDRFLAERSAGGGAELICYDGKTLNGETVLDINHTYEYEEMQVKQTAEHTRAYIKIQDGCNQFCTYCAIPYARGRVRSRKAQDVLQEIRGMVEAGFREVVLTGIHISSYGIDFDPKRWKAGESVELGTADRPEYSGESRLIDLVEQIARIPGLHRIRLGSLEPRIVTDETARRLAAVEQVCPHFHLSLQSGCDATLKRMNRKYTAEEYLRSVEALRLAFDHPAITTDVIVGFPGETEEEFETTKAFLEKVGFYEMHVFKYSKRTGTIAAGMKDQVPEQVKTARSSVLLELEKQQSEAFRRRYIGREAEVLLEEKVTIKGQEMYVGHTGDYVKVAVPAGEGMCENSIVKVKIRCFLTEDILM